MGLSRRKFTKEFKLAAVQRLEHGASMAEVARAFEVNPNVLHRWRREFRQGPASVSGAGETALGRRARWPNWSGRSGGRRWRSIFCRGACSASRSSGSCRH